VCLFVPDVVGVVVTGTVLGLASAIPLDQYIGNEFTGGGASTLMISGVSLALLGTALIARSFPRPERRASIPQRL
jgi:predicted MFS family arabinose efflux permease